MIIVLTTMIGNVRLHNDSTPLIKQLKKSFIQRLNIIFKKLLTAQIDSSFTRQAVSPKICRNKVSQ